MTQFNKSLSGTLRLVGAWSRVISWFTLHAEIEQAADLAAETKYEAALSAITLVVH